MTYFLFGMVFGWLVGLTCFQFRREVPIKKEMWTYDTAPTVPTTGTITVSSAEFLDPDRVGEIIKGKPDVRLDDILAP